MDGNLTQNHLSLAHSSVKKTQLRVTMYSNRYQKHAFVSTFLNSKSDLGCAEKWQWGEVGEGQVRFPETFNLLQGHLAVCDSKVASYSKKRGCLSRSTQTVICIGPEEQCSRIKSGWKSRTRQAASQRGVKTLGHGCGGDAGVPVLNPGDSSGHEKKITI